MTLPPLSPNTPPQQQTELFSSNTASTTGSYALATGQDDAERLKILNELHNPPSMEALQLKAGLRVLTVGCGIGLLELSIAEVIGDNGYLLATDVSAQQLAIARQKAQGKRRNQLHFRQIDAAAIDAIQETFDRVHCRFLLTHLPFDKVMAIVNILYKRVAPGGFLLIEECATISSLQCTPPHPGYDKWLEIVQSQFAWQKSDPSPGERLYSYVCEKQWPVLYNTYQHGLSNKRERSLLTLGARAMGDTLKLQGYNQKELDKAITLLRSLEEDDGFHPLYCPVSQITIYN